MILDRRLKPKENTKPLKPVDLPVDYLKIVEETLGETFKKGIVELKKLHPVTDLKAVGLLHSDEVVLAVTLSHGPQTLVATTFYASADFDPSQPEPGIDPVLETAFDSIATVMEHFLDPTQPARIAQLAALPAGALEEAPLEWTLMEQSKIPVWVKMDKSNPTLESLTEDWLAKNDPHYSEEAVEESLEEAEDFLNDRLEAIRKAQSGSGSNGDSGPIRH